MISILILGSGSATPKVNRNPAGVLVNSNNSYFLVDCGEGTQLQLRRYKQSLQRIHQIFISHLHADHFLGLFGLLSTQSLLGREKALDVFAPKGLQEIIEVQMKITKTYWGFPLNFHDIDCKKEAVLWQDEEMEVHSIPLNHKIDCVGFSFRQKTKPRNILQSKIEFYKIPVFARRAIKNGADFTDENGRVIPNKELTTAAPRVFSFTYISDTRVLKEVPVAVLGTDLLYHEATFLSDMIERAKATHHCTAQQAAQFAALAEVKKLVLGHFSARYDELDEFIAEAKPYFANVDVAQDGQWFSTE